MEACWLDSSEATVRLGGPLAAIFCVAVNAIAQIVWFPAAPLWAFLVILLDVTII